MTLNTMDLIINIKLIFFLLLQWIIMVNIYNKNLDSAVLENYHSSETFKVLFKSGNNPFEKLTPEEFRSVRRRIINCILATDMANHSSQFFAMKNKLDSLDIKNASNMDRLIVENNYAKNEEIRQMILSECVHTADLSNPAKSLDVFKNWTNLVYIEFFNQGDKEKELGLPVSTLCDRNTTVINNSQIGFIKFVVFPQFEMMCNLMPEVTTYINNVKSNLNFCEDNALKEKEKGVKVLK